MSSNLKAEMDESPTPTRGVSVENHPSSSSDAPVPLAQIMADHENEINDKNKEAPYLEGERLSEIIEDEESPSLPHQYGVMMHHDSHEKKLVRKKEVIDDGDHAPMLQGAYKSPEPEEELNQRKKSNNDSAQPAIIPPPEPPVHPGVYEPARENLDLGKSSDHIPLPTNLLPPEPPVHPGAYRTSKENRHVEKKSGNDPLLRPPSSTGAPQRSTEIPSIGLSVSPQDRVPRVSPDAASTPAISSGTVDEEDSPTLLQQHHQKQEQNYPIQPAHASVAVMPTIRPPPPSMLRRQSSESINPSIPFLKVEAVAVEDEPQQPLYHGIPVEEEHWTKRHQKRIFAVFGFIIVVMAVAFGASWESLGKRNSDDTALIVTVKETSPPTVSTSPTLVRSRFPSFLPTSSLPPSASILPTKTVPPSVQPTAQPSFSSRRCFIDRNELKAAINEYTAVGIQCSQENSCNVTQEYGWPIGTWCVTNVTDMSQLFAGKDTFNDDLSFWDVSSVTNMAEMFDRATNFNGDVSMWDTSSVQDVSYMFHLSSFNGNLSSWNMTKVTSMMWMFYENPLFNGDVSKWDTSSVQDMKFLFFGTPFNGDLSSWKTSKVTTMRSIFDENWAFNGDVSKWDTSFVEDMSFLFFGTPFNGDLSFWNTSRVTTMSSMFDESGFNGNVSKWDTSSVQDISHMFWGCPFNGDLSFWNTSSVTTMRSMFDENRAFDQDVSMWNTSSVRDMSSMFWGASSFNQDLSNWDISSVQEMNNMFLYATLFNQSLCEWGDNFPYMKSEYIFSGTACLFQEQPQEMQKGPFCASSCKASSR